MVEDVGRSLAQDEAALGEYANGLVTGVERVAGPWLQGLINNLKPGLASTPEVAAELDSFVATLVATLRELLDRDISDQTIAPLEVMRRSVGFATPILANADVAPVDRGDFEIRNFPDDVYNLTPASFAEIHPDLHEPGLMWGAAKAHVHLRRRREAPQPPAAPERVVALSADLMDRSKISAAFPDVTLVRSPAKLMDEAATATLVIVDLRRLGDPLVLQDISARLVGFGSHVDDQVLRERPLGHNPEAEARLHITQHGQKRPFL